MDVAVATGEEAYNFVTIAKESNPLVALEFSVYDDLCVTVFAFAHIVHLVLTDLYWRHRHILKLHLFVHNVHRAPKSLLNVVLDVLNSDPKFLKERRMRGAAATSIDVCLDVIWQELEPDVARGNVVVGKHDLVEVRIC